MTNHFRDNVVNELRLLSQRVDLEQLITERGAPLLLLDPARIRTQYQALQAALPMVDHHFAIKALRQPAALAAVDGCGGFFDVMTNSDIDLVRDQSIQSERCIHTNPIKKPSDIAYARRAGITTFVVDNSAEVDKFIMYKDDVQLMVRLSFPNPLAKSDLSYKFGIAPTDAEQLVRYATTKGLTVAGFCLHVGSQIHSAEAYVEAITKATTLINKVETDLGITFTILDIGGGFPVDYLEPAPTLQRIADAITPLLKPLAKRLRLLSEPGRFVAASSCTLVTSVVGKSVRNGLQWYYLDDGLYGSYSNVIYEDVTPSIVALREVNSKQALTLTPSVLAGPTCDSVDVITKNIELPKLEIGDYLLSPMMGAYTMVSATDYNGIERTKLHVLE